MSRSGFAVWLDRLEERVARESRRPVLWLFVFAALLSIQVDAYWWPTRDASFHLSIASRFWEAGGPTAFGSPKLFYPPGYGFVISPAFLVSDKPFLLISWLHYALSLAVLGAVFVWVRAFERDTAVWIAGLVVLNVSFWNYMRPTLTETTFMASSLWAILAFRRASQGPFLVAASAGALLLALASSIRYPGILFGCGFGLSQLQRVLRGETRLPAAIGRTLFVVLPAAAVIVALLSRETATAGLTPGSESYLQAVLGLFREASQSLTEGFRLRFWAIGRLLVPGMFKAYSSTGSWLHSSLLVYAPVVAIAASGWWHLVRRRPDALTLTLPLHIGLYTVWLGNQGTRYMLPMLPVLTLAFALGIERWTSRWRHSLLAALVLAHASVAVGYYAKKLPEARALHGRWPEIESLARSVQIDAGNCVEAQGLPRYLLLMLRIELDHEAGDVADRATTAVGCNWLVTPPGVEVPDGFTEVSVHGELHLLRRRGV